MPDPLDLLRQSYLRHLQLVEARFAHLAGNGLDILHQGLCLLYPGLEYLILDIAEHAARRYPPYLPQGLFRLEDLLGPEAHEAVGDRGIELAFAGDGEIAVPDDKDIAILRGGYRRDFRQILFVGELDLPPVIPLYDAIALRAFLHPIYDAAEIPHLAPQEELDQGVDGEGLAVFVLPQQERQGVGEGVRYLPQGTVSFYEEFLYPHRRASIMALRAICRMCSFFAPA